MSTIFPSHLAVEATRALAWSALPDAPVEPDHDRPRSRILGFLRALFRRAGTTPAEPGHGADLPSPHGTVSVRAAGPGSVARC